MIDSGTIGTYTTSVQVSATTSSAISLPSASIIRDAGDTYGYGYYSAVMISIENDDIRIRYGSAPTTGATGQGHKVLKDTTFRVIGKTNLQNLQIIAVASTARLNISSEA